MIYSRAVNLFSFKSSSRLLDPFICYVVGGDHLPFCEGALRSAQLPSTESTQLDEIYAFKIDQTCLASCKEQQDSRSFDHIPFSGHFP